MENLSSEWLWAGQLLLAVVLALPTGWDREWHSNTAGLRTFPLVAMGACAFVIVGQQFTSGEAEPMARIMQGLLSGIGFVGGGAILKNNDHVEGTASAASIWITGAMGAAVGFQVWALAVMLSVLNFAIVYMLTRVKRRINNKKGDQ